MTKYSLTINADSPDELAPILNGQAITASEDEGELLKRLQELLDPQGKTVVIRAKRNSRKAGGETETEAEDETETPAKPRKGKTSKGKTEVQESPDEQEPEEAPDGPDVDFDQAMSLAKEAIQDDANPELAAQVRKAVSAIAANMDGVKKLSDITDAEDQERFVIELHQQVPALFGAEAAEPADDDDDVW